MPSNLDRIKDINLESAKWLNEQGIETYADLAAANPNLIYAQLKNTDKPPASLATIQNWIEEAKRIAAIPSSKTPVTLPPVESTINADGWHEFASFYISYQSKHTHQSTPWRTHIIYRTYADHIEKNDNQQWDGIQGDHLCRWIMRHVETILEEKPAITMDTSKTTTDPLPKPTKISIVSLLVSDPIGGFAIAKADESFNGIVHAKQSLMFDFKLRYQLSDGDDTARIDTDDCHLNCYIYAMPDNTLALQQQKKFRQSLASGQIQDTVSLEINALPKGLYRIRAIATFNNQTPVLNMINIPLLQVI